MNDMTREQLEQYAKRYGIKGERTLSILGKNQQFVNAINSPAGIEFMRYLIPRIESLRINFDTMDIDSSNAKFIEARAKYNEAQDILFALLNILDNQERLLSVVREDINKH